MLHRWRQIWWQYWRVALKRYSPEERRLAYAITQIVGRAPGNIHLYQLALSHSSLSLVNQNTGYRESNERLEYLGDAILGAIVADYLFGKYPLEDEGFLTEIRSRLVSRESLNELSQKIGLNRLILSGGKSSRNAYKSMYGDALEALVGAVYLDKGFYPTQQFILHRLIRPHFDLSDIIANKRNYKSMLIEWAQRESKELRFEIIKESGNKHFREFVAQVIVDDQALATGVGYNKKKAEQDAARRAGEQLGLLNNPNSDASVK